MKSVELDKAKALKDYTADLSSGPVVITKHGKAVAAIVKLRATDLESLLVSESPVFQRIVKRSRASYRRSGGLTRAEMERRLSKTRGA